MGAASEDLNDFKRYAMTGPSPRLAAFARIGLLSLAFSLTVAACGDDTATIAGLADVDDAATDDVLMASDGGGDAAPGNDVVQADGDALAGDVGPDVLPDGLPGDTTCDGPCLCAQKVGEACDDNNVCTTGEVFGENCQCGGGKTIDCSDKNACTVDSCDPGKGCVNAPLDATACDDGNACTGDDQCSNGTCTGAPICVCKKDGDCDDKNPCTEDSCGANQMCLFGAITETTACDDGNACTLGDSCGNGTCLPGAITGCDDANPCTTDSCSEKTGCANLANSATCTDGNLCTTGDTCADKACVGGNALNCDDGDKCTGDACDPTNGCVNSAGKGCDDGNACTVDACDGKNGCTHSSVDDGFVCTAPSCGTNNFYDPGATCQAGSCTVLSGGVSCDDGDVCTDDSCSATAGCAHAFNTAGCNDGNACTAADVCVSDKCTAGVAVSCNDNNPCTDDACQGTSGCVYTPNANKCDDGSVCTSGDHCDAGSCQPGSLFNCDDNNACTEAFCDPFKGCTVNYSSAACDDGNACTASDTCDGKGACIGTVTTANCDDGNACTADSCDSEGACTHVTAPDGTQCKGGECASEGFVGAQVCMFGSCALPPAVTSCDDGQGCTTDLCNPIQGCLHANNTNGCDDGNACTTGDTCTLGACAGGSVNCDDSNACSNDSCEPGSGCKHDLAGAAGNGCSDGSVCTTQDVCNDAGSCVGGAFADCNDNNGCTTDSCDAITGCVHQANAIGCDDGNDCTSGDICTAGKCAGSTAVNCDDQNVCTTDSCSAVGGCQHKSATSNCDDGNVCTAADSCQNGSCVGGAILTCDDNNACTDDKCAPGVGCQHFTNTAQCSDNNACTVGDGCTGGSCLGGVIVVCNDNNPCTDDSCGQATGCVYAANTAGCDDGSVCTKNDVCAGKNCTGGTSVVCDDNNVCTTDSCDPLKGCQNAPNTLNCNDGNQCTTTDTCDGKGNCIGSGGKNCDDGLPCTMDACDSTGGCTHAAMGDGAICMGATCVGNAWQGQATCTAGSCGTPPIAVSCDDSQLCTTDSCNATQGCLHANNSAACDDGNACTGSDTCTLGACVGVVLTCDDNNPCTSDSCNGGCVHSGNSGGPCTDSNVCTPVDTCDLGVCVGAGSLNCDDNNACTTDSCDPFNGCVHAANTLACDDGSACTTSDACSGGKCVGGIAANCDDGNPCTSDSCDATAGCQHAANNAVCDDGDPCTLGDFCANNTCNAGLTPATCNDGNPCTADGCVAKTGCVHKDLGDGTVCQAASCSKLVFSAASTCVSKVCTPPTPVNCDDSLECTTDICTSGISGGILPPGCSNLTKAYGTACTTGASNQKYQFCAGKLCTGIEEANTLLAPNDNTGALFSIDRYASGNITAAGYEGVIGMTTATYNGRMTTIAESPLGIQANATGKDSTAFYDQKDLLAVGGNIVLAGTDANPTTMVLNSANSTWSGGGPTLTGINRTLRAVDDFPYNGNTMYIFGGSAPLLGALNGVQSTLAMAQFDGSNWGSVTRLAVASAAKPACAEIAGFNVTDIYAAGAKQVYVTGTSGGGFVGGTAMTYVATYDGNILSTCNLTGGLGGIAYTDSTMYTTSLAVATSATLGNLRAIHGTSATHMLAGGESGTLFAYDNGAWQQITPAPAISSVKWSAAMGVRSVFLSGSEAWVTGNYSVGGGTSIPCTDWFILHGTYNSGWTWDNLIITSLDLHICNATPTQVNAPYKAWVDGSTGSAYFVGSTYTNAAGTPNSAGPQTRPEILRIKVK
jgi:hypothetical protein